MITIQETRELTLYLVDSDGQPVRAATGSDIIGAGFVDKQSYINLTEANNENIEERDEANEALRTVKTLLTASQSELDNEHFRVARMFSTIARERTKVSRLKSAARKVAKERDVLMVNLKVLREERDEARSARESAPLHPAIARVIEAAHNLYEAEVITKEIAELCDAYRALPSPLPRGVTCGECRFETDCEYHKCFNGGREYGPKWCSAGKRKEES